MKISPVERRFLDLMDRIEHTQQEQLADITRRLESAESRNGALTQRVAALEQHIARQETLLKRLNATLNAFLDPSGVSRASSTTSGD